MNVILAGTLNWNNIKNDNLGMESMIYVLCTPEEFAFLNIVTKNIL